MTSYLAANIKHLRDKNNITQQQLADAIGIKRVTLGSYEEGRAEPKIIGLQKLAEYFKITLDELINKQL